VTPELNAAEGMDMDKGSTSLYSLKGLLGAPPTWEDRYSLAGSVYFAICRIETGARSSDQGIVVTYAEGWSSIGMHSRFILSQEPPRFLHVDAATLNLMTKHPFSFVEPSLIAWPISSNKQRSVTPAHLLDRHVETLGINLVINANVMNS
jgi:hypothetical protein